MTARLSGAKRRLGFTRCEFEGREFSSWINNELVEPTAAHVVDRGMELLKPLGIEALHGDSRFCAEFRMPEYEEAGASMTRLIVECGLGAGFVVVNTGAGWPSKLWPAQRYAEVSRHLGRRYQLPTIVIWAGSVERAVVHEIIIGAWAGTHTWCRRRR